jgi:hypothetical protein
MPGPAPKPLEQRRRQNVKSSRMVLPAEGRQGDPPPWPIGKGLVAERDLWTELWHTPQAAAWEHLGWYRTVARYCKLLVRAEKNNATAALLAEVRQLEDRLGLTPLSMTRLEWMVVSDEIGEHRQEPKPTKRKLRAVDPNAVARS